jgi:exonuclease III
MNEHLKIITYNCKGLKGPIKRENVLIWLKKKNSDVILLQESHYEEIDHDDWKKHWGGEVISSTGKNNARGVTILLNEKLDYKLTETHRDKEGRWIVVVLEIHGVVYTIVNYYGPNKDDVVHLDNLTKKLEEVPTNNIILGGDFNFVYNVEIDKLGGNPTTNTKCRDKLLNWQREENIVDAWRMRHPRQKEFTWSSNTKPKIYCRLDHILINQHLMNLVRKSSIEIGYTSDHKMVLVDIAQPIAEKGRGSWKFNNMLLLEENFVDTIQTCINRTIRENTPCSDRLLWDILKCNIRRECIKMGVKKKKHQNLVENDMRNKIKKIEQDIITRIANHEPYNILEDQLDNMRTVLNEIIEEQCRGAAIRSKCNNYEHGEKATRYFLNMEKVKGNKQNIQILIGENGKEIKDQKEILNEELRYYSELYEEQKDNIDDYTQKEESKLFDSSGTSLEEEDCEDLYKEITEEEIEKIIKESPNNKSPGLDGYSNEFYKHLWPILKDYMMAAYIEALREGEMGISQRRGVISLLPKDGKDTRYLKNWRPLTLLNNDYKFLAKSIADRCKKVLPIIISQNQNGFVPGRNIGANIIRTLDLIEWCNEENIPGLMVNIDVEKAFDSVSWNFMYKALKYFKFPDQFINMIRSLYNNLEICTMNNGHLSRFAPVGRGMRQGCPLSPILFVIVIELLNIYISQSKKLQGVKMHKTSHIISQFADDTSFYLINKKGMLDRLFTLLQTFGRMSGLKLNVSKTEILPMGTTSKKDLPTNYQGLVKEEVKSLGVIITTTLENTVKKNFKLGKEKLEDALKFWNKKKLSLTGKINMLKSQIISKLTYYMSILPDPGKCYWSEINKYLFTFIANGKNEKLKRTALINKISKGGAQMIDMESQCKAMKAIWMIRATKSSGPWTDGLSRIIGNIDLRDFLEGNLKSTDIPFKNIRKTIWNDMIHNWCELNYREEVKDADDILAEPLWYNSHIKIKEKVLWKEKWWDSGITMVWDILNKDQRQLLSYKDFQTRYPSKITFLELGGLKKAIPGRWKTILRECQEQPDLTKSRPTLLSKCLNSTKPGRMLYDMFIQKKATGPEKKLQQWITELGIETEPKELLKDMVKTRKTIMYSKIQSFHYNYWHRNLTYAVRTKKMGLDDNENCLECNEKETIRHLYWDCPLTQNLWTELHNKISFKEKIDVTPECCLMNTMPENIRKDEANLTRLIHTICGHYIHVKKCKNEKRTAGEMINAVKRIKNIEKLIFLERGELEKWDTKWRYLEV